MIKASDVCKELESLWCLDANNTCFYECTEKKKQAVRDAITLLKKQEAVAPKLVGVNTWACGKCGALLGWEEFTQSGLELVKYKFCPECGKAVKWDE